MSKVATPDWQEEDQTDENLVPQAPGTAASVPTTSTIAQVAPTARKASSGFTNLKKYLNANKDNTLINTVADNAQTQLAGAQNQLAQNQQQFQSALQGEKTNLGNAVGDANRARSYVETGDQPLIQDQAPMAALSRPEALRARWSTDTDADYQAMVDAQAAKEKAFAENVTARDTYNQKANQAAADKLNYLKTYRYGGPQELGGVEKLGEKQAQLQDYAKATGTELGRAAILQTLFGKSGQYTAGARNLDNLLLGTDKSNLDKLRALRSQTTGFGQGIKQANQQAVIDMGTTRGLVDSEKANSSLQMKNLRDKLYAQLESERDALNAAGQTDAANLSDEELRKYLTTMAGYDLVAQPGSNKRGTFSNPKAVIGGMRLPTGGSLTGPRTVLGGSTPAPGTPGTTGGMMTLPVEAPGSVETKVDPKTLNYINLYKNRNFQPEDVGFNAGWDREPTSNLAVNPNRGVVHQTYEKNGFGDFTHTAYGNPNDQQALIGIENLKPLFDQTYKDNTLEQANADVLNRRNVLSQVLQDDAANSFLTAQEANKVQTTMDDNMLTRLKQTPKMAEGQYMTDFSAPGGKDFKALQNYKQLGYEDPLKLIKDMNLHSYYSIDGGSPNEMGTPVYNPKTQMIDMKSGHRELYDPETGHSVQQIDGWGGGKTYKDMVTGKPIQPPRNSQIGEIFPTRTTPATHSMTREQFLTRYYINPYGTSGQDNNSSPGLIARKLQEKYILDRLKELGINQYTTDKGLRLGTDASGKPIVSR